MFIFPQGGDNCEVSGCYIYNMPGLSAISVGYNNPSYPSYNYLPQGIIIKNNTFLNGSKNVPNNTIATDCAFIYLNSLGAVVENNLIYNQNAAITNCSGIELHGSNIHVNNNTLTNLFPAIYTGYGISTSTSIGNIISANNITTCVGGIQAISPHEGLIITENILNNVVVTSKNKGYGTAIFTSLNGITGISSGSCINTQITKNVINETSPVYYSAMLFSGLIGSLISNNMAYQVIPAFGISGASDTISNGVIITENIIYSPPLSPTYNTGAISISGSDTYSSTISNVEIINNSLIANSGTINTTSILASGTGTTLTNVVANNNFVVNAQNIVLGTQANQVIFTPATQNKTIWVSTSPNSGTWIVGDVAFNSIPSLGQPKGWICTVAGTPGTWVSTGNL
jgi:hypothetical protein